MNKTRIQELLDQWLLVIDTGEQTSKTKAKKIVGGLMGRIKRTTGQPVIFDLKMHESQIKIQSDLCQELPQWSDLIRSEPAIMDGWPWIRCDFIQLYFEHFRVVVEKLRRVTNMSTAEN